MESLMMRHGRVLNHSDRCSAVRNATVVAVIAFGAAVPFASAADDAATSALSLRGFGTLGGVHSSENNADFVSGFFAPNGAGFTRPWAVGVDTKIGLQVDARFSDKLTAVLQLVSQQRYDNSLEPQVEWANAKYQFTPDFYVRLGRTVTMPFMVSDSRLVGYGNLWIRPPQEVYGLIPVTNKDGIDATYRIHFGDVTNSVHAGYGQTSPKLPASGTVRAKRYLEVSNTLEYGPATLRASYSSGRVNVHTAGPDALVAGLSQFGNAVSAFGFATAGAQALDLANKYQIENAPISVITFGATYDREQWLLMTEWAKLNGQSLIADASAWYATAGYRIGKFTPYMTVARLQSEKRSEAGISIPPGMPPPLAANATALNGGLNLALAGAALAQRSFAAGVRWDFMKNAALKAQYDYLILDSGSSGRLGNVQPNFQPGGKINVISIALDFIF